MAKRTMPTSHTAKPSKGEAAKVRAEENKMMTPSEWERSLTYAEGSKIDERNDRRQLVKHNAKAKALNRKG